MSLLVVGSVALDSLETPFGKVEDTLGGTASYFSLAAAHFTKVNVVGIVGSDFPAKYLDLLGRENIDTKGLEVVPGKTFRWAGRYGFDLNTAHTLDTQLNVFTDFHPRLPEDYRSSDLVFLGNIDPDLQLEVLDQAVSPSLTVLDSMNFWISGKREALTQVMRKVDVVLLNEAEIRQFSGEHNLLSAARRILELGPKNVIIKKGEYGALVVGREDELFMAPAYPLESVKDPTGAGDSFAGGFLGYLAGSGDYSAGGIRRAMVYAGVIASFTVEDFGVNRLLSVTRDEIDSRYKKFLELTFFEHTCVHAGECPRLQFPWTVR